MISQYSNLIFICALLLSPIIGFSNVLISTLVYIAHKYDHQYLWLITTFFLSLFTFGFSKSFMVILFTLIYHGFYNNKLNKEIINKNINIIWNMLTKYKFIVNLKNKINSIHIHPTIQTYNGKLNQILQQLETIIFNSFIKNDKIVYQVVKEDDNEVVNNEVVNNEVINNEVVNNNATIDDVIINEHNENNKHNDDKTNEFISNLLGISIDQVKDLSKDSNMGLTSEEFKMLQTLINLN